MNRTLIEQLHQIAKQYPEIHAVLLFGSRAYGDFSDVSDIDLAIKAPQLSPGKWLSLVEEIEEGLDTLLKIDVVLYEEATKALRLQIDKCNKILYPSENQNKKTKS